MTAGQSALSREDVATINMVFARLKTIFGSKYGYAFKTPADEKFAKREWGPNILEFSHEELEIGFQKLKASDIDWPDVKAFLQLCKPEKNDPIHKAFRLPHKSNINREEGRKRSAALLNMVREA